jgi:hypothetical protein
MGTSRDLAQVETAHAYQVGPYLVLRITGEKPSPCYEVDIEQSPTDVFPPQFVATWSPDPLAICPKVETPYERLEAFEAGDLAGQTITIQTAGGDVTAAVEQIEDQPRAGEAEAPRRGVSLDDVVGPPAEAVGYSNDYDLGAAMKDAMGKLPGRGGDIADWLSHYTVVEIGAEVGGIAGFNRMFVRVRG